MTSTTVKPTRTHKAAIAPDLSTDSDSIVLDSFAGSGTTAQAVLRPEPRGRRQPALHPRRVRGLCRQHHRRAGSARHSRGSRGEGRCSQGWPWWQLQLLRTRAADAPGVAPRRFSLAVVGETCLVRLLHRNRTGVRPGRDQSGNRVRRTPPRLTTSSSCTSLTSNTLKSLALSLPVARALPAGSRREARLRADQVPRSRVPSPVPDRLPTASLPDLRSHREAGSSDPEGVPASGRWPRSRSFLEELAKCRAERRGRRERDNIQNGGSDWVAEGPGARPSLGDPTFSRHNGLRRAVFPPSA